jgi:predicted  nucleic acid-binding Zn-ribbon protein
VIDLYGLSICSRCGRARVIDKSSKSSSCPYCGNTERTDKMVFIYECRDQETARKALGEAAGFEAPSPKEERAKKRKIEKADPYSTMIYKFENSTDLDEKMQIIAKGLTKIKGTFTIEDVAEIVGDKHAEKYVSAMMDRCYIAEVRPGQYKG